MSRSIFLLASRRTPHGVRGLKFQLFADQQLIYRSHPSRGAWIEMLCVQHWRGCPVVFWRVVWYLRGRDRINVVPVRRGCGRRVASRTSHPPCRGRDVAARFCVAVVRLRHADGR